MLGSPCSPCCETPEGLGRGETNLKSFSSIIRTQRGLVINWDVCGTKTSGVSGGSAFVVDCTQGNASDCESGFFNNSTGHLSASAIVRLPANSLVTLTLSGTVPSDSYLFAGIRSLAESDARSRIGSSQLPQNPDVQWTPMPNEMDAVNVTDSQRWSFKELFSWPCGTLGSVVPLYSLFLPPFVGGSIEIMSGTETSIVDFLGRRVCFMDRAKIDARQCCDAISISRAIQHTITERYCLLDLTFRRNNFHSKKHAFAVTLSW